MREPAILLSSDHVVVADKPAGMLTIPGRRGAADPRPCLVHEVARRFSGKVWIVHRLDLEVSGLVVFARSAEAHRLLCGLFERRGVVKRYEAWTAGEPPGEAGFEAAWEGLLVRGKRRSWESDRGKPGRTVARYLGATAWRSIALLRWEMRPETGRSHQIRCQAATRGFPVAGDRLYGSTVEFLPGAIALRASGLEFRDARDAELERLGLPRRVEAAPAAEAWGEKAAGPTAARRSRA